MQPAGELSQNNRKGVWWWLWATLGITAFVAAVYGFVFSISGFFPPKPTALTSYNGVQEDPALSPDGGHVAFAWDGGRRGIFDIYVKPVQGETGLLRLTPNGRNDRAPAWSPDGKTIAFLRESSGGAFDVCLIPAVTGTERCLAAVHLPWEVPHPIAFSPDGRGLLITDQPAPESPAGLFWLALDGGARRRIVPPTAGAHDTSPALSPNGRTLAWLRWASESDSAILAVPLDEEGNAAGAAVPVSPSGRAISGFAWIRDGAEMAVASHGVPGVRVFRADGSAAPARGIRGVAGQVSGITVVKDRAIFSQMRRQRMILRLDLGSGKAAGTRWFPSGSSEQAPAFSPDGARVAFVTNRGGKWEIWIGDAASGLARKLAALPAPVPNQLAWSPDGKSIVYESRPAGRSDLFLADSATGAVTQLTSGPLEATLPAWSRDGRWIYFASRGPSPDIWKIPATGGPASQVTRGGGYGVTESADGSELYISRALNAREIWRITPGGANPVLAVSGASSFVCSAASRDGLYFVDQDRSVLRLLKKGSAEAVDAAPLPDQGCLSIAMAPDGKLLAYATLADAASQIMLATIPAK